MSTQAIRNIINNQISRVLPEVRKKVQEEGKKQLTELKEKLLTQETLTNALSIEANSDTCSEKGKEKFQERADKLTTQLDEIGGIAEMGLNTLQELENKISNLTDNTNDVAENAPNPIEDINNISDKVNPVLNSLNYIVMAAPAILAASSGPAASGTVISNTNNGVNLAKTKIKEFKNLFESIPKMLDKYKAMANKIHDEITTIKNEIQPIIDEIDILKAYIIYLEMSFLDKCNNLGEPNPPIVVPPIVEPSLQDIINQIQGLYGNILEELIARGDTKAIERTYVLNENFQRIKDTKVRIIDI